MPVIGLGSAVRRLSRRRVFMTADAVGGVWTYAMDLARGLGARGLEVELAVIGPHPSASQLETAHLIDGLFVVSTGLPLDWTAVDRLEVAETAAELRAMARRSGADVVHLHAPALAGRQHWPIPLVVSLHSCVGTWWQAVQRGRLPPDLAWLAGLTQTGLSLADAVIAPTRALAASAAEVYRLPRQPFVIHNGLAAPVTLAAAGREGVIFTAGRLWDAGKNITTLDRAAAVLGYPVHAAGPVVGPNGARLVADALTLRGVLSAGEMDRAYQEAAVFASPALYEPFGLAVLEAALRGTALVLSDIPTFRELWDGAAVFHPPHDSLALARALDRIMSNDGERMTLGEQARRRALRYSSGGTIAATLAVYERLMSRADYGSQDLTAGVRKTY